MNPRLLDMLVKENLLTHEQAAKATAEQRRGNERLGTVLKRLGYLSDEDLLDFLSRKYGIPVINLQRVEVTEEITRLIKKDIVQKYQVFPVRKVGNTLTLALSDPTVVLAIDDVQFATGLHVIPVLLGQGRRLFDGLAARQIELERIRLLEGEDGVTHMRYRVLR